MLSSGYPKKRVAFRFCLWFISVYLLALLKDIHLYYGKQGLYVCEDVVANLKICQDVMIQRSNAAIRSSSEHAGRAYTCECQRCGRWTVANDQIVASRAVNVGIVLAAWQVAPQITVTQRKHME